MYPYLLLISVWHTSGTPFNSIICSTLNAVVEAERLRPQQRRCREMATNMAGAVEVWRHVKTWLKPRKVVNNTWSCNLLVCFLMMIQDDHGWSTKSLLVVSPNDILFLIIFGRCWDSFKKMTQLSCVTSVTTWLVLQIWTPCVVVIDEPCIS